MALLSYKSLALPILLLAGTTMAANEVMVTVYYESLCPDSVKLITQQIAPVQMSKLGSYMKLTLVPFGKASFNESMFITCHHGPRECYGNKVHACALKHLAPDQQLKFINCTMAESKLKDKDAEYPTQMCAEKLSIDPEEIQMCVNSTTGDDLLTAQGEITKKFQNPLVSVPSVTFNEKFEQKTNDMAKSNFKETLCLMITGSKPTECQDLPSGASTFISSILPIIFALFLYRL